MKRKQEQKANNVSLFERVKNIIGKNILSVDTRYHMQDTLLIALMIICGGSLSNSSSTIAVLSSIMLSLFLGE